MQFDLTRLKNGIDKIININEVYSFSKHELEKTDIISLDNVQIEGNIYLDILKEVCMKINVSGIMILPCSITLKPVEYPFNINIEGNLEEITLETPENMKKFINSIDILPIIWENILVEIPMKIISPDVNEDEIDLHGDGWQFVNGNSEKVNSKFSELYELLEDSEVR